jgi:putative spermidine/putrescine transport system ATP-binding protein
VAPAIGTTESYLSLAEITKSYDGIRYAVDHVSLDIRKGEFVTFLGPSGSGKTTTLTMIAGFETPSGGQILLNGRDLIELQPWRRNVGMVFQNYALFPHMTVARNVAFPLRMRGVVKTDITARVREILALVGLSEFVDRYPRELSGGQQQRVALARGLVFRPDVLLLDEPLGALDKNLREQMQLEIKRIHSEVGITMVYVTHDQTEAMTMSDRIAVFNAGRIEQVGTPLEIYSRPQSRFVGAFVGESNFLRAQFIRNTDGPVAEVVGLPTLRLRPELCTALQSGTAIDLMIRPENMQLTTDNVLPGGEPSLPVTIEQIVNFGDTVLVICRYKDLVFRVRSLGQSLPNSVGQIARVSWLPKDVHLIG